MNTGKEAVYGADRLPQRALVIVQALALIGLAATCFVVWKHWNARGDTFWACWFYVCWAGWVFLPPIWFSVEYFYLFKPRGAPGSFEAFKYGQELASRAWLGIAAVMSFIATKP